MEKEVAKFVCKCLVCQQVKLSIKSLLFCSSRLRYLNGSGRESLWGHLVGGLNFHSRK